MKLRGQWALTDFVAVESILRYDGLEFGVLGVKFLTNDSK
jgi:hypothetical protein